MPQKRPAKKRINLALQGGGAHGAYAWGVLDYLLEDDRVEIEGISATSAGTMNAVCLTCGMAEGDAKKARSVLKKFWERISEVGEEYNPVRATPWESIAQMSGLWNSDQLLTYSLFDSMTRVWSPYQFNPFDINPLRMILEELIDFDALRQCHAIKLFISATNVRTGKVKVFHTSEVTLDVAMASACLPFLFKAVEVKGEYYWDGGYMGNPALFPLFYNTHSQDILVVHINPIEREEVPFTAPDIMNRINEISFNASLMKEMRAIEFAHKLIEQEWLKDEYKDKLKYILLHSLRADEDMRDYTVASKFISDWDFLTDLRDKGRAAMAAWLDKHYDDLNERSTVDVRHEFL